jgi:predicted SAM-dependent methyltransferase
MVKLLIWGTGKLAKRFIDNNYKGEIVGFIETNKSAKEYMGKYVYSANEIISNIYDYIIVANSYATEIYRLCLDLNIDLSKVIFLYGVKNRMGCTDESVLKEILQEKNYTNYCAEFNLFDDTFIKEDAEKYSNLNKRDNFGITSKYMWPIIKDKFAYAGTVNNYFWQDLWAARLICKTEVKKHFDIGSRLDGFIAHILAAGLDVTMIDVREFPTEIEGLNTIVDDATSLKQIQDNSIESMSALCSLEHFGLGRYGDPIEPEACFKCFDNIQRKLKKGGRLYISLPIGKERVEFNAHRVFYASTVIDCFSSLKLMEYSCVTQEGIKYNVDIHKYDKDNHNGEYRYGLFLFEK